MCPSAECPGGHSARGDILPSDTGFSHMTTVVVTAFSTAVWTLDHLKYTYLEG